MSFKRRLQHQSVPATDDPDKPKPPSPRDWYSASGTGWGVDGKQPNPFAVALRRIRQDVSETASDLRDEPAEVPYRVRRRLADYMRGRFKD